MRIEGVDPTDERLDPAIKTALAGQMKSWGKHLSGYLVYARRPTIFRAVRGMWGGLETSGLLEPGLVALVNRRVAAHNRCEF
jgi:hypothetical protein